MSNKSLDFNISDIVWFLIGIILILAGIKNFRQVDMTFTENQSEAIATLKEISNLVKVKNQHNLVWMTGDEGQSLNNDSLVYAGDFSKAKIDFKNGSQVIILPGTILRVYHDSAGKFKMQVKKGKAFKITEHGKKLPLIMNGPIDISGEEVPEVSTPTLQETSNIQFSSPQVTISAPRDIILEETSTSIEFKWEVLKASNPNDSMVIEIRDPNEKKLILNAAVTDLTLKTKITQPGIHYWVAKSQGEILDAGEFKVIKLYPPLIVAPKNRSLNNQTKFNLEWSYGERDDMNFEVESINGESKKIITVESNFSLPQVLENPKLPFSWRVRAKFKEFSGPWSETAHLWPAPVEVQSMAESTPSIEEKHQPVISLDLIKKIFNSKYFVDRLPYEVKVKNLPPELSSLAIFHQGKEIKSSGDDSFKFKVIKDGIYPLEWYQVDGTSTQLITTNNLEIILNPLDDSISLPADIVLELKSSDKK